MPMPTIVAMRTRTCQFNSLAATTDHEPLEMGLARLESRLTPGTDIPSIPLIWRRAVYFAGRW